MKSISVYLGAHPGNNPVFCGTAHELGRRLALDGWRLIYGGANVGTMKALADGCLEAGGSCVGVFPSGFKGKPEYAENGIDVVRHSLTEMIYCADFSERKAKMEELGDCCVALPGSWGTMDELFTYATNSELKFNGGKRIFVLNLNGYYEPLKQLVANMHANGFILDHGLKLFTFCNSIDELMSEINSLGL